MGNSSVTNSGSGTLPKKISAFISIVFLFSFFLMMDYLNMMSWVQNCILINTEEIPMVIL